MIYICTAWYNGSELIDTVEEQNLFLVVAQRSMRTRLSNRPDRVTRIDYNLVKTWMDVFIVIKEC